MRPIAVPLLLLLNGCATLVVERYQVGHGDRLEEASLEAARRLGWETRRLKPGTFRLVSPVFPIFAYRPQIDVTAGADGVLSLAGIEIWKDADKPRAHGSHAGAFLTEATLQVLGEPPKGPPVPHRSALATAGLDLLLPTVGAFYALRESPYRFGPWAAHAAIRVGFDALAVAFLSRAVTQATPQREVRLPSPELFGGLAAIAFAANRLLALAIDVPIVVLANSSAESGLWLDADRGPQRLP